MIMYDFKTFAQMNLDLIFKGFSRMPQPGEEVFADSFTLQLGGGPQVCPIVLDRLDCSARLGTFMGDNVVSDICRKLLAEKGFTAIDLFPTDSHDPVVVTSVFSWPHDRGFLAHNEQVRESCLDSETVYGYLKDAKVVFAPTGHPDVIRRLHEAGVKIVFDTGWSDDMSIDDFKDFLPYIDVYTPNDKEAMKIAGTDDLETALRFLVQYTPNPVITLGKGGCAYIKDGQMVIAPIVEDFVAVDTTGAGDNFLTGIIYGLIHDEPMERCIRLGNIFAGHSTTEIGCYGAEISMDIIRQYMEI